LAQAYERAVAPAIGSMLACAIGGAGLVETCSIATSSPSRRAPIRIVCTLLVSVADAREHLGTG